MSLILLIFLDSTICSYLVRYILLKVLFLFAETFGILTSAELILSLDMIIPACRHDYSYLQTWLFHLLRFLLMRLYALLYLIYYIVLSPFSVQSLLFRPCVCLSVFWVFCINSVSSLQSSIRSSNHSASIPRLVSYCFAALPLVLAEVQ